MKASPKQRTGISSKWCGLFFFSTLIMFTAALSSAIAVDGQLETPAQPAAPAEFPVLPRPMESAPVQEAVTADSAASAAGSAATEPTTGSATTSVAPPETLSAAPTETETKSMASPMVSATLSLVDMGQSDGLILNGGQSQSGVAFTLPAEWVVTGSQLMLNLDVSNELRQTKKQLNLILNGQPLGKIDLSQHNDAHATYQLEIPPALMVSHNNLSFSISQGSDNSTVCAKEANNQQWVKISPTTQLKLEGQLLNTALQLARFPHPFFDALSMFKTDINIVFGQEIKEEELKAASIVSAYFGTQPNYRSINFRVLQNSLPERDGIIFGRSGEQIGPLTLPNVEEPTLQLIDNPANATYKLLLIVGNDGDDLRQAAFRLISQPLPQEDQLQVTTVPIAKRKAYDAPRWISTEEPVHFSRLIDGSEQLTVNGDTHDAIHIPFHSAPDLFVWGGRNIPMQINYRFPINQWIDQGKSQLSVTLNGMPLRSLPVNKVGLWERLWHKMGGDTRLESYDMELPPYLIYGDNLLSFYFLITAKADAPCGALNVEGIKSHIKPDSYIDLSQSYHFTELPNLSYYVGAAFPFSKFADFSESLILLSKRPSISEIQTLLELMARAGNATGVAVSNTELLLGLSANQMADPRLKNKDILVVSSLTQHAFIEQLLANSPFSMSDKQLSVKPQTTVERLKSYLLGYWSNDSLDADRFLGTIEDWRGFLSFRSVADPTRIVVLATASNDQELVKIDKDLQSPEINAAIRNDLAIITSSNDNKGNEDSKDSKDKIDNKVNSFQVGERITRGEMPLHLTFIWYASQHLVLLALCGVVVSLILGLMLYSLLRNHATRRLGRDREDDE